MFKAFIKFYFSLNSERSSRKNSHVSATAARETGTNRTRFSSIRISAARRKRLALVCPSLRDTHRSVLKKRSRFQQNCALQLVVGPREAGCAFFQSEKGCIHRDIAQKKDVLVQLAAQLTALPRAALLFSGRDTCSALRELSEVLLP